MKEMLYKIIEEKDGYLVNNFESNGIKFRLAEFAHRQYSCKVFRYISEDKKTILNNVGSYYGSIFIRKDYEFSNDEYEFLGYV